MNPTSLETQLSELNPSQQECVEHLGTPLLILAGPGSGKTRVITMKIAWLISQLKVAPEQILAMTFTNKAAKEMKARVKESLDSIYSSRGSADGSLDGGGQGDGLGGGGLGDAGGGGGLDNSPSNARNRRNPFVSTFHSFGAYMLRWFHEEAELPRSFQIYDFSDQVSLLKESVPNLSTKEAEGALRSISFLKDRGETENTNSTLVKDRGLDIAIYQEYEKAKRQTGNVDFGDLLLKPYLLLKKRNDLLQRVKERWSWFLVDEYQDTNTLQFRFLELLCGHTANFCVVGDDDQSIYKFRGAVVENILNFQTHFPRAKFIRLEQNYRSTPQILDFANALVSHNSGRHSKKIYSTKEAGEKPIFYSFRNELVEKQCIAEIAKGVKERDQSLGILFRINSFSRNCETALIHAGLAYEVVGAVSFYEREEVKNALALLRMYKNRHDFVSFKRIINKPSRGIGAKSVEKILLKMKEGSDWEKALEESFSELSSKAQQGAKNFASIFSQQELHEKEDVGKVLECLLEFSGLLRHYRKEDAEQGTERIYNLEEILRYASEFRADEEGWREFFEQITLVEQRPNSGDSKIQLMTLHRSKGLEFDVVLICGVEEGLIPFEREGERTDYEEERRLLYVGVTRARRKLVLSHCTQRRRYYQSYSHQPSMFIGQVDEDLIKEMRFRETYQDEEAGERDTEGWDEGVRVEHEEYGPGIIKKTLRTDKHLVVEVEFSNDYEAMFIPLYTPKLRRLDEDDE